MTYSVYQHWDPLRVCIVGRSYAPEFYSFIKNSKVRTVMERIAHETEEDYQKLITLLESFGVEVLRPTLHDDYKMYLGPDGKVATPPMTPRDYSIMLGDSFYFMTRQFNELSAGTWDALKGADWPDKSPQSKEQFDKLPESIKQEIYKLFYDHRWQEVIERIKKHNNVYCGFDRELTQFNSAQTTRIGKDLYVGTMHNGENLTDHTKLLSLLHPEYRYHVVDTRGHADGVFCPVVPGLIISLRDIPTYKDTFPGWEVIYLQNQGWDKMKPFVDLKRKNGGKWWVPGEELNDDFTNYVEQWLGHWVGYVEETVFDVNMLVIDKHNVVCNNYNKEVFDAFERHGVTPHIVNFRHRYFWDGGLHCITSDIHREGTMQDYFPERG